MYRSIEDLRGYRLNAKDGHIGRVRDVLFEEHQWGVRWLVADTGKWLPGKKVILSPVSLGAVDADSDELNVKLTREEIESSPHLDHDAPVSREFEKTFFDHYEWPYYWTGGGIWGSTAQPMFLHPDYQGENEPLTLDRDKAPHESSLRSAHELTKYRVEATDDGIGHVSDLLIDPEGWVVRFLVVDTRNWLPGKHVLLRPQQVRSISWVDHQIRVDCDRDTIKSAPEYEKGDSVGPETERKIEAHYASA